MIRLLDHHGAPARQHRIRANGVELHVVEAGAGPALLLIHGTPKTHIYWRSLLPLLTPHFRVIAPDLRGAGVSGHPYAEKGYTSPLMTDDLVGVLNALEVETAFVHGEDRGAEYAYVLAGRHPERVRVLSFAEMMLSGFGLEERSFLTEENVTDAAERRGVWEWHVPFFFKADVSEMLIAGKEREFWTYWLNLQCYDPTAQPTDLIEEWISLLSTPHGLRGTLDTYKATLVNAKVNRELSAQPLSIPVLAIGASHFFGDLVQQSLERAGVTISRHEVFERCGHSLALEEPEKLAALLIDFFGRRSS
ncbi:alpha/beta hydrolase [Sinorhizobium sp. BJ1]|uniref:alpha/beta fold hydrolase n=1 Tax=Sinorhizobium sp. BJ1 TaxID=2035455 RepID=UPI000614A2F3|nr:alpha/beta hydrolase [Sinorhizobium sp. BJ1]PDT82207.1 alpha/beta hydrolase [Sinorhizobium sp. BJ1]